MFSLLDLRLLLCSCDLYVLRVKRIISFLLTQNQRSESLTTWLY